MFATNSVPAEAAELTEVAAIRFALSQVGPAMETAVMVDQIRALRELGSVLAAAEAQVAAAFVARRRSEQVEAGLPARRVGQGIPQELGLARRESPTRAGLYAGFAGVLLRELPATFAALKAGLTTEWRATMIARETGWLSLEHRLAVDAEIGPRLGSLGDRQVHAEAARLAYRLDPYGKLEQLRRAVGSRRVGLMPADAGMSKLCATLPLEQGVAVIAALNRAADQARASGDERSRGQVMSDTLVELVTGQRTAAGVPLRVDLIITDQTLFNTGPRAGEPATVSGYGPIPAPAARDLIARTDTQAADTQAADTKSTETAAAHEAETAGEQPDTADETPQSAAETPAVTDATPAAMEAASQAMLRIRRLFTDPAGRLVAMETGSREFTHAMAELIKLRDQWCSTPFCGAPIRHIDHLLPWAEGGPTSLANAQGLCEACNYAKQAPGWTITPLPDGTARTTTPTGHDTTTVTRPRSPASSPNAPPASAPHQFSRIERRLRHPAAPRRPNVRTATTKRERIRPGIDFVDAPHRVSCELSQQRSQSIGDAAPTPGSPAAMPGLPTVEFPVR